MLHHRVVDRIGRRAQEIGRARKDPPVGSRRTFERLNAGVVHLGLKPLDDGKPY
jgi:hypothetical protein